MLTITCMKWIPEDPTTIFLTTRFYLKNSTKIRFYVFLNFHARYFFYFFSWSGPNSEEILNFTPIYFGCPGTYNWNKICSFLWNSLLEYSYMFSRIRAIWHFSWNLVPRDSTIVGVSLQCDVSFWRTYKICEPGC